jgi:hypothetical protein
MITDSLPWRAGTAHSVAPAVLLPATRVRRVRACEAVRSVVNMRSVVKPITPTHLFLSIDLTITTDKDEHVSTDR